MRCIVGILLCALVSLAFAEVSDKAASQVQLWSQGAIVGFIALALGLFRPLLALVLGSVVALLFAHGHYSMFADPYVGTALLAEHGEEYRIASSASFALPLVGAIIGTALGLRSRTLLGERRVSS